MKKQQQQQQQQKHSYLNTTRNKFCVQSKPVSQYFDCWQ